METEDQQKYFACRSCDYRMPTTSTQLEADQHLPIPTHCSRPMHLLFQDESIYEKYLNLALNFVKAIDEQESGFYLVYCEECGHASNEHSDDVPFHCNQQMKTYKAGE